MHTLSETDEQEDIGYPLKLTDIVGFIKYNDTFFAHLCRDLLGDLRIEEVVERVDDDIEIRELRSVSARLWSVPFKTHHSSDDEVWADAFLLSVLFHVVQGVNARRYEIAGVVIVQFLRKGRHVSADDTRIDRPTS